MERSFLKFIKSYAEKRNWWNFEDLPILLDEFRDFTFFVFNHKIRRITYVSENIINETGYTAEELKNATIEEIGAVIHQDDYAEWVLNMATSPENFKSAYLLHKENKVKCISYRVKHKNNCWVWLNLFIIPLEIDPMGNLKSVLGLLRNCSKEKLKEAFLINEIAKRESSPVILNQIANDYKHIDNVSKKCSLIKKSQEKISPREIEVLQLIAKGFSNKEIAEFLFISPNTAVTHRKNLLSKFNVKNSAELVKEASKMFWLI